MNTSFLVRTIGCALIFSSAVRHAGAADELLKLTAAQQTAAGITTAPLMARQGAALGGLPGQVVIPNEQLRMVSTPLAGLVETVLVAAQQPVRKGQVLARLQSPGLADVQHTYLQASAQHQLARAALDRDEKLFAEDLIAQSRLEATRSRQQEVAADVAERTQALRAAGMSDGAIAQLRSGRGVASGITLTAPFDGVVLEQLAVAGQRLEAAAPVLKIARLDPLWVEVQVPLDRLAAIAPGAEASVPAADAKGRVISVGRAVASGTQTVSVRVEVRSGAARLRPGQLVEVVLAGQAAAGVWTVPTAAIARIGARALVYRQTPEGFVAQTVTVLDSGADTTQVQAPFQGNERVAVKGVTALKAMQTGVGGAP
jgi:membrane fusion protein, heavy metal efflux system